MGTWRPAAGAGPSGAEPSGAGPSGAAPSTRSRRPAPCCPRAPAAGSPRALNTHRIKETKEKQIKSATLTCETAARCAGKDGTRVSPAMAQGRGAGRDGSEKSINWRKVKSIDGIQLSFDVRE